VYVHIFAVRYVTFKNVDNSVDVTYTNCLDWVDMLYYKQNRTWYLFQLKHI